MTAPVERDRHNFWALRHLLLSQEPLLVSVNHDARPMISFILGSPVWLGTFARASQLHPDRPLAHIARGAILQLSKCRVPRSSTSRAC